jgi:hypothetical protein
MPSTVSLEVVGGPFVAIPWTSGMTAQDAIEAAYDIHLRASILRARPRLPGAHD